jgi:hypothetical protein
LCGFLTHSTTITVSRTRFAHIFLSTLGFQYITAKEHVCAQQHAKGARQWHQEEEEDQVRFDTRNGSQIFEKPKICQKVQSFQA